MVRELRRIRSGDEITSDWANALVDAVTSLSQITAAYPLEVHRDAAGLRLSMAAGLKVEVVELTSDLNSGGTATAKRLVHDGDDWVDAATSEITVEDALARSRAPPAIAHSSSFIVKAASGLFCNWNVRRGDRPQASGFRVRMDTLSLRSEA